MVEVGEETTVRLKIGGLMEESEGWPERPKTDEEF